MALIDTVDHKKSQESFVSVTTSVPSSTTSCDEHQQSGIYRWFRGRASGRASVTSNVSHNPVGIIKARSTFFVDADAMKEKVRATLADRTGMSVDLLHTEGWCQSIVRHSLFERLTILIIGLNVIWIAVETDRNPSGIVSRSPLFFQAVEQLFCMFFVVEWLIRVLAFKMKTKIRKDPNMVFDTALIIPMVLEQWVLWVLILVLSNSGWSGDDIAESPFLKIAKLLRLMRMARMIRLVRTIPELMIIIKGMIASIRSVGVTLALLIIILYMFGVAFTQLTAGTDLGDTWFHSVTHSMYVLGLKGTLLDNIRELTDALGTENFALVFVFFVFVLLTAFTVMNMLIGVLCEVVNAVSAAEKEQWRVHHVREKVGKVVKELDCDNRRGFISKAEFAGILENSHACRALQDVGVDVPGLIDFADSLFLDKQGHAVEELSFPHFMDVVLQLRGSNNATVKDVVELRKLIRNIASGLNDQISRLIARQSSAARSRSTMKSNRKSSASSNLEDFQRGMCSSRISRSDLQGSCRYSLGGNLPSEKLQLRGSWSPFMPDDAQLSCEQLNGLEAPAHFGRWCDTPQVNQMPQTLKEEDEPGPASETRSETSSECSSTAPTTSAGACADHRQNWTFRIDTTNLQPVEGGGGGSKLAEAERCRGFWRGGEAEGRVTYAVGEEEDTEGKAGEHCTMKSPGTQKYLLQSELQGVEGAGRQQWCPIDLAELQSQMRYLSRAIATGQKYCDKVQTKLHQAAMRRPSSPFAKLR